MATRPLPRDTYSSREGVGPATVVEKPAYRRAFIARRCLLPADGYDEWLAPEEPGGRKQPVYLSRVDGQPLALAGLWETWTSPQGERVDSCVVLTTTAVDELGHVHDRAPVFVDKGNEAAWLDPGLRNPRSSPACSPGWDRCLRPTRRHGTCRGT